MPWTHFASPSLSSPLCLWHALHWQTYSHYIRFTSCAIFILKTRTELDSRQCSFSFWLYRNQSVFVVVVFSLALRPQKPEIFVRDWVVFSLALRPQKLDGFSSGFESFSVQLYVHRNQTDFCQRLGRFQYSFTSTETRGGGEGGGGFVLLVILHYHHQNESTLRRAEASIILMFN